MNILDDDVIGFIKILYKNEVRYILVGGLAVNYYGYSRTTGDVDIWLEDTPDNRNQFVSALKEYGIEGGKIYKTQPLLAGYSEIMLDNGVYIDLMAALTYYKQEEFEKCYEMGNDWEVEEGTRIKVLHINQLIEEKEHNNRLKDQDDAMHLKQIRDEETAV